MPLSFLVASDTHGRADLLLEAFERAKPDGVFFLGDGLRDLNVLPEDTTLRAVRGNCEAEVDQMVLPFPCMADYALLSADGISFYLTHGHHHNPAQLPTLREGTVFLSGHTHVKLDETRNGIRCLNPGSVSIPKDGSHSCLIFEDGNFRFHIWEE